MLRLVQGSCLGVAGTQHNVVQINTHYIRHNYSVVAL